jgi:hypothetical protein
MYDALRHGTQERPCMNPHGDVRTSFFFPTNSELISTSITSTATNHAPILARTSVQFSSNQAQVTGHTLQ